MGYLAEKGKASTEIIQNNPIRRNPSFIRYTYYIIGNKKLLYIIYTHNLHNF